MSEQPDAIPPVLSAEEWADISNDERIMAVFLQSVKRTSDLPVTMALANFALPDDSPYKITREDVDRIRWGAAHIERTWHDTTGEHAAAVTEALALYALASKLAALLPPEA